MRVRRLALLTLFLGVAVTLIVVGFITLHDVAPPDDSHLTVAATRIPDAENGLLPYTRATSQIVAPDSKGRIPRDLLDRFLRSRDPKILEILAANAPALELFDAAMKKEHFVIPVVDDISDPIPSLFDLVNIRNLVLLRARGRDLLGQTDLAIEDCLKLLQLGHAFQASNATLISAAIGHSAKIEALDTLIDLVHTRDISPSEITRIRRALEGYRLTNEHIEEIIKREYICTRSYLLEANHILYKKNATLTRYLDYIERCLADVPKPDQEKTADDWARAVELEFRSWRRFVRGNLIGEEFLGSGLVWTGGFSEFLYFERVADVLLALRLYQLDHARLPVALEHLVPHYLDEIPVDPFDGEPLRYSADPPEIVSPGRHPSKAHLYRVPIQLAGS